MTRPSALTVENGERVSRDHRHPWRAGPFQGNVAVSAEFFKVISGWNVLFEARKS